MVTILLAAYNGEKYISQQIDSILNQSHKDFKLYIRDDCSSDNTREIIKNYCSRYPEKIMFLRAEENSGSAKNNFMFMMSHIKDDYVFLSDQDDVWLPNKIEITLSKILKMQDVYGKDTPLLVHTDLKVTDKELHIKAESYRKMVSHPDWNKAKLPQLLPMNIATGSTICYNRALADIIRVPEYCVMHDWWLLLIALCFGQVGHIFEPTVLYRQHESNELGIKSDNMNNLSYIIHKMTNNDTIKERLVNSYRQAHEFLKCYEDMLEDNQKHIFSEYINIPERNKILRLATLLRLGVPKYSFIRNAAHYLYV